MAMADYTDMEKEIKEAPEPKVLPRGTEVRARIIAVRSSISEKNDAHWYQPVFDVPDDPMVVEFNDFFWDLADREKMDAKSAARSIRKVKTFAEAMGLDYTRPFDWEEDLIKHVPWFYSYLEPMPKDGWIVLDSGDWTIEQTVAEVLTRTGAAAKVDEPDRVGVSQRASAN